MQFQSTQPEWAATKRRKHIGEEAMISIHAARVGCDGAAKHAGQCSLKISIHAARVGCDLSGNLLQLYENISIHAARVGCDSCPKNLYFASISFQSTQPEWAATTHFSHEAVTFHYFNPRSPSGLRHPAQHLP